jgi:hypothetical protein
VRKTLIVAGILALGGLSYYVLKFIGDRWASFGGDVLIALVIYLEVQLNRFAVFEREALDEHRRGERAEIYSAFFEVCLEDRASLDSRRAAFAARVSTDKSLRVMCENQIVLFNHLWFFLRSSPISKLLVWNWFPHVVVPFWVMVGPYVLQKQRTRGGWTEDDLMDFTLVLLC